MSKSSQEKPGQSLKCVCKVQNHSELPASCWNLPLPLVSFVGDAGRVVGKIFLCCLSSSENSRSCSEQFKRFKKRTRATIIVLWRYSFIYIRVCFFTPLLFSAFCLLYFWKIWTWGSKQERHEIVETKKLKRFYIGHFVRSCWNGLSLEEKAWQYKHNYYYYIGFLQGANCVAHGYPSPFIITTILWGK